MKFAYLIEPPFNHRDADGRVVGCDIELARTVFGRLGISNPLFIEATFAELIPGLAGNRWEMTTGLFDTEERREVVCFSRPIWALPDGLLVKRGNPRNLEGYASLALQDAKVAVIRDQVQHQTVIDAGIEAGRIMVLETYEEAAAAVQCGMADAYASVAMAHSGYLANRSSPALEIVTISPAEKKPAIGAFAFAKRSNGLRDSVDKVLADYLGTPDHRSMMHRYGFHDTDIDLIASA
jgi:polar amino acid transport system substrate-binding protein